MADAVKGESAALTLQAGGRGGESQEARELLECLHDQGALLTRVERLLLRQRRLLRSQDASSIAEALADSASVIQLLCRSTAELSSRATAWKTGLHGSIRHVEEITRMMRRNHARIRKLSKESDDDVRAAAVMKAGLRAELGEISGTQAALHAYRPALPGEGRRDLVNGECA